LCSFRAAGALYDIRLKGNSAIRAADAARMACSPAGVSDSETPVRVQQEG